MDKQRTAVIEALCRLLSAQADAFLNIAAPSQSFQSCVDSPPSSPLDTDNAATSPLACLADIDTTFNELQKWTELTENKVSVYNCFAYLLNTLSIIINTNNNYVGSDKTLMLCVLCMCTSGAKRRS
jgi:hypothetical protein